MKSVLTALFFLVSSCALAVFGTIIIPGELGFYIGVGLVAITILSLLFPKKKDKVIAIIRSILNLTKIKIGPFSWDVNDFCRGWIITGQTGSGKTVCAIKTILAALFRDCPNWGGVIVDQKGQFYRITEEIANNFNMSEKLVILQLGERAKHQFNLLSYPGNTWNTYADIIVETAESIGVKVDSFWKSQAVGLIRSILQLLAKERTPTFSDLYDFINNKKQMKKFVDDFILENNLFEELEDQTALTRLKDFMGVTDGQKNGVEGSLQNIVDFFGVPAIRKIFCPDKNTVNFQDIDKGKIFVVSMPQKYSRERIFINIFLKLLYATHARQRFDNPGDYNLLAFVADEAQKVVTSSQSESDDDTVAYIREARATYILATQSTTSLSTKLNKEHLNCLLLNMLNQIYFTVADPDSAKLISGIFGEHTVTKTTKTVSGGKTSTTYREVEEPVYKPSELRSLKKYECIIRHTNGKHKKMYMPPVGKNGKIPYFYYRDRFNILGWLLYLLQV